MKPEVIYELEYTKDCQGWGYIITTKSGRNVSKGYPTKEKAQKATQEIVKCILKDHHQVKVKGRESNGKKNNLTKANL